ncbi:DUF2953 domain-containing protein [uncultured Methanobrevibacter sp.]|uniref:DUF2953 domain-containing protein n=2 Tax=uncultured Methanobrevibacter sp. TaxID=253161 RepID=UPI0025D2916A|nr:DUF2953 domain-containing protein [uncultured Methanobrevibacter sp.]
MLNILLMIILLIIILIFIILLVGIRLKVKWVKIDKDYDGCLEIILFRKIKVYTYNFKSEDDDDDESEEDENERDLKKLYELAKPCFDDLKKFLHEFLDAVDINRVENDLVIGFSNFAKTGEYIGYIWAILAIINSSIPNSHLRAHPSFTGEVLNLKGFMNIDIYVLKLIVPLIRLISKKEIRELITGV